MKHAGPEEWSGYARGVLDLRSALALENHLGRGCRQCERLVKALRAVLEVTETNLRIQPPAFAVNSVQNLFRVRRLAESERTARLDLKLGFDSFGAAALLGARSNLPDERQMVYESPALTLDLKLQSNGDNTALKVRGQLFDADSRPVSDIPAFLLEGDRIYSQDLSGQAGDFRLLGEVTGAPRLCLLTENENLVELQLPGLLDRAPGPQTL